MKYPTSVYIHIPFCSNICSYCDFTKLIYNEKQVDEYLESLKKEINNYYKGEIIETIYIGGGTPSSLTTNQLNKLLLITKLFKKSKQMEFTIEINPDISKQKIEILKRHNVNRVSIGVQTINQNHLKFLNRYHTKIQIKNLIKELHKNKINNINVDLIYAIPTQTIIDIKKDLDFIINLNITHISTYSLIIENNTILKINNTKPINQELDYKMYISINNYLKQKGFIHYEISNYAINNYQSKHNLTYWNNNKYYGFGLGASGFIGDFRYQNTTSLKKYLNQKYLKEKEQMTKKLNMSNEIILGLRKINGVNKNNFKNKYNQTIAQTYEISNMLKTKQLIETTTHLKINKKYLYISNNILMNFID